jgi:hypothetical protein
MNQAVFEVHLSERWEQFMPARLAKVRKPAKTTFQPAKLAKEPSAPSFYIQVAHVAFFY